MGQIIKQPKWKKVEFSRSAIIKAGSTIKNDAATEQELKTAHEIIDNWRAAHAFPQVKLRKLMSYIVISRTQRQNQI